MNLLEEKFISEFKNFLDKFGEENSCNVGIRLPKYYEDALIKNEIDVSKGIQLLPQIIMKEDSE